MQTTFYINAQDYRQPSYEGHASEQAGEAWPEGLLQGVNGQTVEEPEEFNGRTVTADNVVSRLVVLRCKLGKWMEQECKGWSCTALVKLWQTLDDYVPELVLGQLRQQSPEQLRAELEELKKAFLGWAGVEEKARGWWKDLEETNADRLAFVIRVVMELGRRGATLRQWLDALKKSEVSDLMASLHLLDYQLRCAARGAPDGNSRKPALFDETNGEGASLRRPKQPPGGE